MVVSQPGEYVSCLLQSGKTHSAGDILDYRETLSSLSWERGSRPDRHRAAASPISLWGSIISLEPGHREMMDSSEREKWVKGRGAMESV